MFASIVSGQESPSSLSSGAFKLLYDGQGVTSLSDSSGLLQFLPKAGRLGSLEIRYRQGNNDWVEPYTEERHVTVNRSHGDVVYRDAPFGAVLGVTQRFRPVGQSLEWTVTLESRSSRPVTVGDLGFSLPWHSPASDDPKEIFERSFIKHQFISGAGSFLYFTKPNGQGPYLVVTCLPGTKLEYYTPEGRNIAYRCFVHSAYTQKLETRGTWRQSCTSLTLGAAGSTKTYGLRFEWADSYDKIRQILFKNGLFDVRVVPGMTLPSDLTAKFSLHTQAHIEKITPEFPDQTDLHSLPYVHRSYHLYQVKFNRLGENKLTIYHDGGRSTVLEFFSCEPLETLVKKRAWFLTRRQQHKAPGKWYDGLYSEYDMKQGVLRGPEDTDGFDGWWGYVLACDDPILGKAPFIAEKNVWFPDRSEIASLEYYIRHYVWGHLQRTDQEAPYPYGVYGTPNYFVNRHPAIRAQGRSSNLDKMHVWRSYDYPHVAMLYYHMYEIATKYPSLIHDLDASICLDRAYQTARAYFSYPYEILTYYETYKIGCYNELVILDIASALKKAGQSDKADLLLSEWEKKVKYFVYDDPYPFRSEYSFDRTAFESSYAFAKYGATHDMKPDEKLWFDKAQKIWYSHPTVRREDSLEFMRRQLLANVAVRGWIEPSYYLLGADFTSSSDTFALSYMAAMGGWGILDYAENFASEPSDWLQLGYASYLSSWALMNSGRADTNYGFWFPGKQNDGAAGWQFTPAKTGHSWARNKEEVRGPWHYDGEIDLGYGAALRMASTVVTDDPIFGWIAYGGQLAKTSGALSVIPKDGLRVRYWGIGKKRRIDIELDRDGFAENRPIVATPGFDSVTGIIENRTGDRHLLHIKVAPSGPDDFGVFVGGKRIGKAPAGKETWFAVSLRKSETTFKVAILRSAP